MALESGSQILNIKGDPNLAYGTAGTTGTAAPLGVLDPGTLNQNGFDNLARATFLKDRELYDAKKKETDEMYKAARDLDLDTAGLLDIDRQYIINNDVKQITDYLTAHPYAQTPKTPEQIKENIEFKKLYDNYKNHKAQGQVRAALAPTIQKNIADNTFDRDEEKAWYDPQLNKPLQYLTPYGKTYQIDVAPLKGDYEEVIVGKEGNVLHTDTKSKTNGYTTYAKTLAKTGDVLDKNFQGGMLKQGDTYLQVYKQQQAQNIQDTQAAAQIPDSQLRQKALDEIAQRKPYLSDEIYFYNNVATENNKLHPDKLMPIFDTTKPLSPQQLVMVQSVSKNVSNPLDSYEEKESDLHKSNLAYQKAIDVSKSKLESKGFSTGAAGDLVTVLNTFKPQASLLDEYTKGIGGDKAYNVYTQADINGDKIRYKDTVYSIETPIVKTKDGHKLAQVDGTLIEYDESTKKWNKVEIPDVPIDNKVLQTIGADKILEIQIKDGKIVVSYVPKGGTDADKKKISYGPMEYLKLISPTDERYKATIQELTDAGLTNLDDPDQMQKALDLLNSDAIDNQPHVKSGTQPKVKSKGKAY